MGGVEEEEEVAADSDKRARRSNYRVDTEYGSGSNRRKSKRLSRIDSHNQVRQRRHRSGEGDEQRSRGSRRSLRNADAKSRQSTLASASSASGVPISPSGDSTIGDVEMLDFDPNEKSIRESLKEDPKIVEETMQENIFSLIYIAPVCSGAFWFAFIVALFQLALPALALLDLFVLTDDEGNYMQLPNNVPPQVRVISGMVLILAVIQFWDLMEAVEKLQNGPPPSRSETPEGATWWKFYLSYSMQMIMGALFEISVFVFVMQSTTILDVFLNFAALEFIVSVDEFAFKLAKKGYVSNGVKRACDEVSHRKIMRRKGGRVFRRLEIIFFAILMLAAFGILASWQDTGQFDCEKVEVQFGDGFITILPVFSGIYSYEKENQKEDDKRLGRPVYWDERRGAAFRYCIKGDSGLFSFANTGYWVFNIVLDDIKTIDDMCDNYISRSPETKGHDLLEFPGHAWETKRLVKDTVQYETDFFQLRCSDCQDETCNGKCIDDKCVCDANQYGFNCQFSDAPCPKTDYDRRTTPFQGVGDFFSSKYSLLTKADGTAFYSYNRPVYFFTHENGYVDLLINFGRRFFVFDVQGFNIEGAVQGYTEDQNPIINTSVIAENLTNFHPWYSWIKPLYAEGGIANITEDKQLYRRPVFVSDPIDVGTQSDSLSPLGLRWRRVKTVQLSKKNYFNLFLRGTSIETILLCSRCSESSPCLNEGICNPRNFTCSCPAPEEVFDDDDYLFGRESEVVYSGTLCELDCTEEGNENLEECQPDFEFWADDDLLFFGDDELGYYDDYNDNFDDITDDRNGPAFDN